MRRDGCVWRFLGRVEAASAFEFSNVGWPVLCHAGAHDASEIPILFPCRLKRCRCRVSQLRCVDRQARIHELG